MKAVDTIKTETLYLICGMTVLSALMEAIYLILGKWSIYVLLGNMVGAGISVFNFYLMALTVKRALNEDAEDAKKRMKMSQQLRLLMVFVVVIVAASLTVFDLIPEDEVSAYIIALILPLLFNRFIIAIRAKNVIK